MLFFEIELLFLYFISVYSAYTFWIFMHVLTRSFVQATSNLTVHIESKSRTQHMHTYHNCIGLQSYIKMGQQHFSWHLVKTRHNTQFMHRIILWVRTYSKGHDKINHAFFVITLSSTQAVPFIHDGSLSQALWDRHVCPCDAIIHGKRPLSGNTEQSTVKIAYCQKSHLCMQDFIRI